MKHIVMFSGGVASAYTAYLVKLKENKKDIILLHTPTLSEHKDADRFRKEVKKYLDLEMVEPQDGRNIWELIDDENCLPSQFIPFCTRILKQQPAKKYIKKLKENYILYYGYGIEEWRRIQKQMGRLKTENIKTSYPIFEEKITNDEIKKIIENDWGIKLPIPYKFLKHNNCIPCFKAGKAEWKNYYLYFPEQYKKAVEKEKQIGHTVFKDITLEELANIFEHNKIFEDNQCNMFDNIPCECVY